MTKTPSIKMSLLWTLVLLFLSTCTVQPEVNISPLNTAFTTPIIADAQLLLTYQPGYAKVTGTIVSPETGSHPIPGELFLGELVSDNLDFPVYSLDVATAPRAIKFPNGDFLFVNVPPGKYGLVFWTPVSSYLIIDSTGASVVFTAQADEVIDLGELPMSP